MTSKQKKGPNDEKFLYVLLGKSFKMKNTVK